MTLSQSPLRKYAILDKLQEGVWISDAEHRLVFVNAAMARIAGVDASLLLGQDVLGSPEKILQYFRSYFTAAMESLEPCAYECPVVTPANHLTWQGGWLTPLVEDGKYTGMICTVRDITEEKQLNARVTLLPQKLNAIFDSDLIGIVQVKDRRILWANPAFAVMFGYTPEEIIGKSTRILYESDEQYQAFGESAYPVIHSGQTYRAELRHRRKDGTFGWHTINLRLVAPERSEMIGVCADITKQKESEISIIESKQQLELALRGSNLGLWVWDIPSGHVTFNEHWCAMLGYRLEEIEPNVSSWKRLVHPDDWPAINGALEPHLKGETADYESEHRLRHKEGHWVWVLDRGKVLVRASDGEPLRAAGTHLDISDRKRLKSEGTELLQKIEMLIREVSNLPSQNSEQPDMPNTSRLTPRQRDVIALIAAGLTSSQIAQRLGISPATAITHRRNMMRELGLHSSVEVARYAIANKLIHK